MSGFLEFMQKVVGQYRLVEEIGKGQFGQVFKAKKTDDLFGLEYAVKVVSKEKVDSSPNISRLFKQEIEVMKLVKHQNLLALQDFLETSSNYYVVVDYCRQGDLEKFLEKVGYLSEDEAVYFLKQIMCGFMELYRLKVIHRDFKLANIFLQGDLIIIGDFGFAKAGVDATYTKLGTPYNMAPEILFSNGTTMYTNKTDLWSIGVVFYQMLTGVLPFRAQSMNELKIMVIQQSGANLQFPANLDLSEDTRRLLKSLLQYDPNVRINWTEFFNHHIFQRFREYRPATSSVHTMIRLGQEKSTSSFIIEKNFTELKQQINQDPVMSSIIEEAKVSQAGHVIGRFFAQQGSRFRCLKALRASHSRSSRTSAIFVSLTRGTGACSCS